MNTLRAKIALLLVTLIIAVVTLITIKITMIYAFGISDEQDCPEWLILDSRQSSPLG